MAAICWKSLTDLWSHGHRVNISSRAHCICQKEGHLVALFFYTEQMRDDHSPCIQIWLSADALEIDSNAYEHEKEESDEEWRLVGKFYTDYKLSPLSWSIPQI